MLTGFFLSFLNKNTTYDLIKACYKVSHMAPQTKTFVQDCILLLNTVKETEQLFW